MTSPAFAHSPICQFVTHSSPIRRSFVAQWPSGPVAQLAKLIHSFVRLFVRSFVRSFIHSFIHSSVSNIYIYIYIFIYIIYIYIYILYACNVWNLHESETVQRQSIIFKYARMNDESGRDHHETGWDHSGRVHWHWLATATVTVTDLSLTVSVTDSVECIAIGSSSVVYNLPLSEANVSEYWVKPRRAAKSKTRPSPGNANGNALAWPSASAGALAFAGTATKQRRDSGKCDRDRTYRCHQIRHENHSWNTESHRCIHRKMVIITGIDTYMYY